MTTTLDVPTEETQEEAKEALRELASMVAPSRPAPRVMVQAEGESAEHRVVVPRQAFELFLELLGQLANGNAVTIVPVQAELTTQQAADILNVSRPYLVSLLENEELRYRKVGTHRRISASELFAYKARQDANSAKAVDELTAEAQRLGLGY